MSRLHAAPRVLVPLLLAAVLPAPTAAQDAIPDRARRTVVLAPVTPADAGVIFLVRHAEKAERPAGDPPLTEEGRIRALALASLLADAGLDAIWSTEFRRSRATAAPVARGEELEVGVYDPARLEAFAATLAERGGRALVVGHSNTTPALVELLGGEPGPPIDEAGEYDRLYIVTLTSGKAVTTLLRFGRPRKGG